MDPRRVSRHAGGGRRWTRSPAARGVPRVSRRAARGAGVDASGGGGGGGDDIRFREEAKKPSSEETDGGGGSREPRSAGVGPADARRRAFLRAAPTAGAATETATAAAFAAATTSATGWSRWRARESLEELIPVPSALTLVFSADQAAEDGHTRPTNVGVRRLRIRAAAPSPGAHEMMLPPRAAGGASGPARAIRGTRRRGIRRWSARRRRGGSAAASWTRLCPRGGSTRTRSRARWRKRSRTR